MNRFCGGCGSPIVENSKFCPKCGMQAAGPSAAAATEPQNSIAQAKELSTAAKLVIAAIVIIFVGGGIAVAGMLYAAHRVSQKFDQVKATVTGGTGADVVPNSPRANSKAATAGDPCRYLSKADVSAAIGVEIVKVQGDDEACSYFAKGSAGDMAAKHTAAMLGAKGADDKTQKLAEQFGQAIFSLSGDEKHDGTGDGEGNVPVFNVSVSNSASAVSEMKLNAKVLKNLGGPSGEDLQIGDQAFLSGDSMIMVRKGGKIVRIMYMTCPCGTQQVIPLVKKLVNSL